MLKLIDNLMNRWRTIEFRKAKEEDIPQVIEELREFSKFCGGKTPLFQEHNLLYTEGVLKKLIKDHVFYGAFVKDKLVGFIAGTLSRHLFNPEIIVLNEVFFWVRPEFRNSKVAKSLLDSYIKYGKINADWVLVGVIDKSTLSGRSLEKRGFKLKEQSYLMEV